MRRVHPILWLSGAGLVTGLHAAILQAGWPAPSASTAGTARPLAVSTRAAPQHAPTAPDTRWARKPTGPTPEPRRDPSPQVRSASPAAFPIETLPLDIAPAAGHPAEPVYLPRSALTRPPRPLTPIEVPYPDTAPLGHWQAQLSLFIDAQGQVRQVRVDAATPLSGPHADASEDGAVPTLPAALADSARQAFLQARFAPGERSGQAVASRFRIEVEFQALPLSEPQMDAGGPALADPPADQAPPIG